MKATSVSSSEKAWKSVHVFAKQLELLVSSKVLQ